MALQYSDTLRNNQLDQFESTLGASAKLRILTGSAPANVAAGETGTLLIEITVPSDFMNAASGGSKTKLGTWSGTASAGSAATPGYFRFATSGGTAHVQGTCGIGSGDLSFDGTITSGQTVTVNTFTVNAGNA
jgi:hypothetical protein